MPKALFAFIYFFFFLLFLIVISKTVFRRNSRHGYYWIGLIAKIAVGVVFAYISKTIYSGDSLFYFQGAKIIVGAFHDNLFTGFELMNLPARTFHEDLGIYTSQIKSFFSGEGFFMSKITGLFALLSFGNYYSTTLWFSFISFLGSWALFKSFERLYPNYKKELFIFIFFLPSVIFWGSGILKDTLTLASVELITWGLMNIMLFKRRKLLSLIVILICSLVLLKLKAYILVALLPAIAIWLCLNLISKLKNKMLRNLVLPIMLMLFVAGSFFGFQRIGGFLGQYSLEKIVETAYTFQVYHSYLGEADIVGGGSAYSLGDVSFTPIGIIAKIPAAINVTLFRPYIWESNSIFIFMAFIESTFFMLLTVYSLIKLGLRRIVSAYFNQPVLAFCITFSLILAFAVGFTAFNFGALVRFKIPLLPFYALFWIILLKQKARQKQL